MYNKWRDPEGRPALKSPKCSEFNVSENVSPRSHLKSVYNKSDWSVLKNMQLTMPRFSHKRNK